MTKSTEAGSVDGRSAAVIEAFVIRARRIAAHSLASDPQALILLSRGHHTMTPEADGLTRIRQAFPAEEQMESFAARVRPVMLDGDPVYLPKVLNAISYFVREMPEYQVVCQQLRDQWKKVDPRTGELTGYLVQHIDTGAGTSSTATDSALALAWLYGDVVHASTERQALAGSIPLDERYRSAAQTFARVAVLSLHIFGFVMYLRRQGVLVLSDSVFKQQVVVTKPDRDELGRTWIAPVGTEVPAAGTPFGEGWRQLVQDPPPAPEGSADQP